MFVKYSRICRFVLFVAPCVVWADLGLANIQAVCKVELKDGSIVEGVMLVATGGYINKYDTYGFYLVIPRKENDVLVGPKTIEKAVLFNTDFHAIQPFEGIVERSPNSRYQWGRWFENPKVFYLRDVTNSYYYGGNVKITTEIDTVESELILRRQYVDHTVCELRDCIPVFPEIPEELYLTSRVESVKPIYIDMEQIERFELVLMPSQRWLDKIAAVEKAYIDTHEMYEVLLPEWWHNVMKNKASARAKFKRWGR